METFPGLPRTGFKVRTKALHEFLNLEQLEQEKENNIIENQKLRGTLDQMHKEAAEHNTRIRTHSKGLCNTRTNVVASASGVGDYAPIRKNRSRRHKLGPGWTSPIRIIGTKSDRVFQVKDLMKTRRETVHALRVIDHPAQQRDKEVIKECMTQAEYLGE